MMTALQAQEIPSFFASFLHTSVTLLESRCSEKKYSRHGSYCLEPPPLGFEGVHWRLRKAAHDATYSTYSCQVVTFHRSSRKIGCDQGLYALIAFALQAIDTLSGETRINLKNVSGAAFIWALLKCGEVDNVTFQTAGVNFVNGRG